MERAQRAAYFDCLHANTNKYQIVIEKYLLPESVPRDVFFEYIAHDDSNTVVKPPKIALSEYLQQADLEKLLLLKRSRLIRQFINEKIPDSHPKGFARVVFQELIYSVLKLCKSLSFDLKQTGAVLSQYYLTHLFFTSALEMGPDKVYHYFKDIQMHHSLPFVPANIKLFDLEQTKQILIHFHKIYVRNLPIIRLLTLPNFALNAGYKLEPEFSAKKGKKGKKGKKDKKAKKSKKGKK